MRKKTEQDILTAVIANDIGYIKSAIEAIQETLKKLDDVYVKKEEARTEHKRFEDNHKKFEEAIENINEILARHETFQTQVKTWGAAAILAMGIIQFLIGKFL